MNMKFVPSDWISNYWWIFKFIGTAAELGQMTKIKCDRQMATRNRTSW